MTVEELACRFPEVSADLCDEPLLAQFAETFGTFLQEAENPGACSGAEIASAAGHEADSTVNQRTRRDVEDFLIPCHSIHRGWLALARVPGF